jgi:hypothetical protein
MNAVLDCPDFADLIEGMARDLAWVQPDGRGAWLIDFRQGVGSEMPSEVVDELVAGAEQAERLALSGPDP